MNAVTALLFAIVAMAGCRTGRNYDTPEGPRYAGGPDDSSAAERANTDTLRLASFNIEFALQVDSAIAVLQSDPELQRADVLLLQEMNEKATERIAEALGMWYVYYPAIFHFRTSRQLGNAVLSRWPIVEDRKIVLPHVSRFVRTQRTATAFIRGLDAPDRAAAGTVLDAGGSSDHLPVWAVGILPQVSW